MDASSVRTAMALARFPTAVAAPAIFLMALPQRYQDLWSCDNSFSPSEKYPSNPGQQLLRTVSDHRILFV
jgi:hypothetical protein